MKLGVALSVISSVALAAPASADITANYIALNNFMTMKIEIASNGDVRAATSNPNAYFIIHDNHSYMVQASFNGPAVMRVEDITAVMTEQMKRMMPHPPKADGKDAPAFSLRKGGIVTIRGRQGIAYYTGEEGDAAPRGDPFVVISTDPELSPLGVVMARQFELSSSVIGQTLGGSNPFKSVQDILKTGAPLALTGMQLDTITHDPIPAARFVLPSAPLKLEEVRKNMGVPAQ